jgi:Serine incorporator (Serinc)
MLLGHLTVFVFGAMKQAFQLGTCAASCAAWCCCSAVCSTLSTCCSSGKNDASAPPGPTSGRKRSVVLLFFSVGLQFLYQFGLAQYVVDNFSSTSTIRKAWLNGCESVDINGSNGLQQSCVGNAGSYRIAAVTSLFFVAMAIISGLCKPTVNREAWSLKVFLYLAMVGGTVVVPNEPIFTPIYRSVAIGTYQTT